MKNQSISNIHYLLYDNECPFCSNIVERISSLIRNIDISYNHLKSKKGQELTKQYSLQNIKSVIYINHNNKVFIKSNAILNLCKHMIYPYNIFYILNIIPSPLLNLGYDFIAKNRMRIKL